MSFSWWWSRNDGVNCSDGFDASWDYLCSIWLFECIRPVDEFGRGAWWYVFTLLIISSFVFYGAEFLCANLGSPWGAGTFAGPTGARQPSELELELASTQGKVFWETVSKVSF